MLLWCFILYIGHKTHCLWCCFDVLFCILGIRPHYTWEWWFVWYIGRNPITYVLYKWFHVLGVDLEAPNWWDVCVAREALEHMSMWCFVLSEKLWNTWVFKVCVERDSLECMTILNICVEREASKHMIYETFVWRRKLWSTWKDKNWKCWA